MGGKKNQGGLAYEMEKMKILSAHEMKHDVEFLNQREQLKGDATAKGKEGKNARKYMKLRMKHEKAYEGQLQ